MALRLLAPLTAVLVLVGCAAAPPGASPGGALPIVVATTTQVGSLASEIGGEQIDLSVLLEPGIEAHDFELSTSDAAALERADVILKSGAGLESWLDDALETIGDADRVRDMSAGVTLREGSGDAHEEEEAGHEEEHDPHYWLSAANAILMAQNVREAITEVAPESADLFAERTDAIVARLERADTQIRVLIDEIPEGDRKLVTDHDALGYFAEAYGLEVVGFVFPMSDVAAEPSAADIAELVAAIRENNVRAIFPESAVNPRLAEAVAEETATLLVSEPLYSDALGPAGSGADTLDGMLLHNARVIRDALIGD